MSSAWSATSSGPRLAELIAAVEAGDLVEARALNESLLPVFTGIFRTQGVILVKAALRELGLPAGPVRPPLVDATPEEIAQLRKDLAAGGIRAVSSGEVTQPHLDLKAPPPLPEGGLRVMALGGLGEIGRNMTVFEYDGRLLVVDCGVLFPEVEQPGVDLILPDFGVIEDRLDDVDAIVLTHGHEDHIGAVPYLLRMRGDIPLVGSQFTLALVEAKLREHRIDPTLVEVAAGDDHVAGPFDCEFFAVNHSIPDALAVAVHTPAGTLLHTGDFKMDQLPLDGVLTDLGAFARLGLAGVDLLLSDSTNAEVPGFVTPERSIGPVLDDVFARASQRLIVSCFACHVHRVQQVLDCAETHDRKVALVGRSMVRNMGIARDLGLLRVAPGLMVSLDDAASMPPEQVVLMSTGSQGEPLSALGRMARGDHHQVTIDRRRHRRPRVLAGARQRDRRLQGDQRPGPARRDRGAQGDRPGARVRARAGRRAAHAAQRGQAALPDAGARRVAAPAGARRAGRGDRHDPRPRAARRGRRRRRPRRRQGVDRGQRADRQRLRRRAQRRRRGRGVAAGAADPRRRGLRRADRRHRAVDPHDRARRCTCPPAASPTTRPPSTTCCAWSRTTSSGRCRTTRSTRTGSRRSSAGRSASG